MNKGLTCLTCGRLLQVTSVQRHAGPVTGLHFNPHKASSHLLASGGADSEVFIMALDRPDTPNVFVPGPKPNTVSVYCVERVCMLTPFRLCSGLR